MEQKIQELEEQIKIIEETLDEIKQVLNTIAERETHEQEMEEYYERLEHGRQEPGGSLDLRRLRPRRSGGHGVPPDLHAGSAPRGRREVARDSLRERRAGRG